jgi:tetratricopeptide (TPR) repeat protein
MKRIAMRAAVFIALAAGFGAATVAVPRIAYHYSRLQPDNYRFIALQEMRAGDFAAAAAICRRRIASNSYDFEAHYLLAEAQARGGDPDGSAATAREILRKVPAALGKKTGATGYDEARTYQMLASSLWKAGKWREAVDMARAAMDCGTAFTIRETSQTLAASPPASPEAALASADFALKMRDRESFERALAAAETTSGTATQAVVLRARWLEEAEGAPLAAETLLRAAASLAPLQPEPKAALRNLLERHRWTDPPGSTVARADLTTGVRSVALDSVKLPQGASVSGGALSMGRNGAISTRVNTGVFKVTNLLLNASGTDALGLSPVLVIRAGDRELTRLYLDSRTMRTYDLPLWPEGAPKTLDLTLEFVNDAYDPVTRADRNVRIGEILLH